MAKTQIINTDKYGVTTLIRINWEGGPSGYAENPDNWTFL
jgi:hypothetical protein